MKQPFVRVILSTVIIPGFFLLSGCLMIEGPPQPKCKGYTKTAHCGSENYAATNPNTAPPSNTQPNTTPDTQPNTTPDTTPPSLPPTQTTTPLCTTWLAQKSLKAHQWPVYGLAFQPGSQLLASSSAPEYGTSANPGNYNPEQTDIRLWDVSSGKLFHSFKGHQHGSHALAFDPKGEWFLSGSIDKSIRIWNPSQLKEIKTFSGHTGTIAAVAISPNGDLFASAGYKSDSTLRIWDRKSGKTLHNITKDLGYTLDLAFSPDGKQLLSVGYFARLWDVTTGKLLKRFSAQGDALRGATFSQDGKWLAYGQNNGSIQVRHRQDNSKDFIIKDAHTDRISSLRFSQDSKTLLSSSWDGSIRAWTVQQKTLAFTLTTPSGQLKSFALHPSQKWIAAGHHDGTILLWKCL